MSPTIATRPARGTTQRRVRPRRYELAATLFRQLCAGRRRAVDTLSAEDRAAILQAAVAGDHRELPRWQPGSLRDGHTDAVYDGLPAWRGREHWTTVILPRTVEAHRDVFTARRLSPATFIAVMAAHATYARHDGRDCIVRPDTIGQLIGTSKRTVQTCRAVARELGLMLDVVKGGMLTVEQRMEAQARGSRQRGWSNVSALLIPADIDPRVHGQTVDNREPQRFGFTPSRGTPSTSKSDVTCTLHGPLRGPVENGGASRRSRKEPGPDGRPGTASAQAKELARYVPWLAATAPRRMAAMLRPYVTGPHPWQPQELAQAMLLVMPFPHRSEVTHPLSLLKWYLGKIPATESPAWSQWVAEGFRESQERERQAQAAAAEHRRREEAAATAAAVDPQTRDQIVAEIRATLAAQPRRHADTTPIVTPGPRAWRR